MWINLALYGFLAIGLFPDSVFSQEQDLCETCTGDDCTVKIHNVDRRFYKYNGDLYYFETDKEKYSWLEGHARCTTMFLGYSVQPTNLVSFHTKQEFDFIKGKLMSLSIRRAFFGGRRSNDNIYDWVWTDGSTMNKNLIPSLRPQEARNEESLWNGPQPDNWYERENVMEIKNYGFHQLNDVPETYKDGSFVCKISCTKSTCNQPRPYTEDDKNTFFRAVYDGDCDLVKKYLGQFQDIVHAKSKQSLQSLTKVWTTLQAAAYGRSDSTCVLRLLIDAGANIEERVIGNDTPFETALMGNKIQFVTVLIEKNINVNAQTESGKPFLHIAARYADSQVVGLLLNAGAEINAKFDYDGNTALHVAADRYVNNSRTKLEMKLEVLRLLLANGADKNAVNNNGKTALDIAERSFPNIQTVGLLS